MFDWVLNTPLIKSIYMIFESVIKQFREKEGGGVHLWGHYEK